MGLASGTRLGPYEIEAPIGAGGMGEVYRARDTRLGRTVAIKVLPDHLTEKLDVKQRFEREARAISSLQHPNICTLYDVGREGNAEFLVMEYLEGESLSRRLARGPLQPAQVLKYGIEICEGLDKAHQCGFVHRDLKPGNIMLTKTGAKLLDFRLAKRLEVASAASLSSLPTSTKPLDVELKSAVTGEGAICGTFQYISPEQLQGGEADPRSDIFALGAVLFEMATGKRAFDGQTQSAVIAAVLEREPPLISSLQSNSPPAFDHVVKSCLEKNSDQRWQSVHDVKLQLQLIANAGGQAGVPGRVAPRRRLSTLVAWIFAVCILVAAAFASGLLLRKPQPVNAVRSSVLPPQNSSFLPFNFAISPDSSRLAFIAFDPEGKIALWVRSLSSPSAQRLGGTDDAEAPFWSPDNRAIGFFANGRLKTVDLAGGSTQTLCVAPMPFGATWNRDGTIVFGSTLFGPLNRVQASGGTPTSATKVLRKGSVQTHRWPFFLPDGKHFLYTAQWSSPADPQGDGVYAGSLDTEESKLISTEITGNVVYASGYLLYVRDRRIMAQPFDAERLLQTTGPAVPVSEQELEQHPTLFESGFSASQSGALVFQSTAGSPSRLEWFDPSGKELTQFPEIGYSDPTLSPDGRLLAVSSDDERNGRLFIRVYDLQRGVSTRLTDGGDEHNPFWSPDGKRIGFHPGIIGDAYEVPADGSAAPRNFANGKVRGVPNDWSPDGHMVFMVFSEEHPLPSLAIYSPSDNQVSEFASKGVEAKFSSDGKWIVHAGGGIFVESFPQPGTRIQVADAGAQPLWSHDGKKIFYVEPDRKLMVVSFDPQRKSAGAPQVVFQTRIVETKLVGWQYAVAPDGRFLINSLPPNNSSPFDPDHRLERAASRTLTRVTLKGFPLDTRRISLEFEEHTRTVETSSGAFFTAPRRLLAQIRTAEMKENSKRGYDAYFFSRFSQFPSFLISREREKSRIHRIL